MMLCGICCLFVTVVLVYLLHSTNHHWVITTFHHEWPNKASAGCDRSREEEKRSVWFPHSCREEEWGMHQLQTMALYPRQWLTHKHTHSLTKHRHMHTCVHTSTHKHTHTQLIKMSCPQFGVIGNKCVANLLTNGSNMSRRRWGEEMEETISFKLTQLHRGAVPSACYWTGLFILMTHMQYKHTHILTHNTQTYATLLTLLSTYLFT